MLAKCGNKLDIRNVAELKEPIAQTAAARFALESEDLLQLGMRDNTAVHKKQPDRKPVRAWLRGHKT